jgi:hypothetical protein
MPRLLSTIAVRAHSRSAWPTWGPRRYSVRLLDGLVPGFTVRRPGTTDTRCRRRVLRDCLGQVCWIRHMISSISLVRRQIRHAVLREDGVDNWLIYRRRRCTRQGAFPRSRDSHVERCHTPVLKRAGGHLLHDGRLGSAGTLLPLSTLAALQDENGHNDEQQQHKDAQDECRKPRCGRYPARNGRCLRGQVAYERASPQVSCSHTKSRTSAFTSSLLGSLVAVGQGAATVSVMVTTAAADAVAAAAGEEQDAVTACVTVWVCVVVDVAVSVTVTTPALGGGTVALGCAGHVFAHCMPIRPFWQRHWPRTHVPKSPHPPGHTRDSGSGSES